MNERLKELVEQAGFEEQTYFDDSWVCGIKELELFEKLVRQDERKLNAKLCEEYQFDFARAIREGHRL
jgi:hypothetical protein